MQSLALTIGKKMIEIPLAGTMGAPVFGGAGITKCIEEYQCLSSRIVTDPAAEDINAIILYCSSDTIQATSQMMDRYLYNDFVQMKEELQNISRHANSRVYMYSQLYIERLCEDPL
jgi:hypothetical protein